MPNAKRNRAGLTFAAAAAELGVSAPRVAALVKQGRIAKLGDGSLDPESVRRAGAILDARNGAGAGAPSAEFTTLPDDWASIDYAEAVRRKEAALAWRRTLEARTAAGELLERGDVDAAVIGAFARVRARMLALPHALAPLVAGLDAAAAAALLTRAVHDALDELAGTRVADLTLGVDDAK